MKLVLDASAAIEIALNRASALKLSRAVEDASEVTAPDLFVSEVTNAAWKYHRFANVELAECDKILEFGIGLVDSFVPCVELYREAFQLARTAKRPAYDAFYLALARREDALFMTMDADLRKHAAKQGIRTS